ncbi:MAG: 50S ribosomal protein L18, partial [Fibrobacterota bacterium]
MDIAKVRITKRKAKHAAARTKVLGTAERPRLAVRRTLKHMIAQVIDDSQNKSLLQLHSGVLELKGKKAAVAKALGKAVSEKLKGL